jgi:hypothetical protein
VTAEDGNGGRAETTVTIEVTDVDETEQTLLQRYDVDISGCIELVEARTAVGDYFASPRGTNLSLEEARQVVGLFFGCRLSQ